MRRNDWRIISSFGYVFGIVAILVGIYGYVYYETNIIGWIGLSLDSYRNFAIPVIIIGVALLVLGYFADGRGSKTKETEIPKQKETLHCPVCGANRDSDAIYCKKCGKKFS